MRCKVHPTYVGKGSKPRSNNPKCCCSQILAQAKRRAKRSQSEENGHPTLAPTSEPSEGIVVNDNMPRFSNGRPKPVINTEPLLESSDTLIEAALAQKHPELHQVRAPEGYRLRGSSTLVDGDGNVISQWIKTAKTQDDPTAILDVFRESIKNDPIPAASRPTPPKQQLLDSDLLSIYLAGDPHIGMLSWHQETGEDFDSRIARDHLVAAMDRLISLSPASETAIIANLGDGLHADGFSGHTTAGTRVDTDGRWPKMVQVFIETFNYGIRRALEKHNRVIMANIRGNHDELSSVVLAMCMAAYWKDEPRVTVEPNTNMFYWHEFGSNLLGFTHGHTVKPNNLPGVMACDQAEAWGRTKFRYMFCGHVHHEVKKEYAGVIVEYFRTLAGRDNWHHGQGYRAGRSMSCDVLHKNFGRIVRHELGVEQLRAATVLGKPGALQRS